MVCVRIHQNRVFWDRKKLQNPHRTRFSGLRFSS